MSTLTSVKQITQYGPRDFDASFDGQYIGSFRTRFEAQTAFDDYVLGLCQDGLIDQPLAALSSYTCLGCGGPLPVGRGGHCDACVEWDAPSATVAGPDYPEPDELPIGNDPAPGRSALVA